MVVQTKRMKMEHALKVKPNYASLKENVVPYGKYEGYDFSFLSVGQVQAILSGWKMTRLRDSEIFKALSMFLDELTEKHRHSYLKNKKDRQLRRQNEKQKISQELEPHDVLDYSESDELEMEDNCPLDWNPASANCFHASRWQGEHQDGPNCTHERRGGTLVVKEEFAEMANRRQESSLLNEKVMFGKHKGKTWRTVPKEYCEWLLQTFDESKKNRRTRSCASARLNLV